MAENNENMGGNSINPEGNQEENSENGTIDFEDEDNMSQSEFDALNAQLDQLNEVLDTLEAKNDVIHSGLIELLNSNREARKQFQESQQTQPPKNEENPKS